MFDFRILNIYVLNNFNGYSLDNNNAFLVVFPQAKCLMFVFIFDKKLRLCAWASFEWHYSFPLMNIFYKPFFILITKYYCVNHSFKPILI